MSAPEIKVVKGNPTEDELAALRAVLAQMSAKHSGVAGERNEWGNPAERFERAKAALAGGWAETPDGENAG